MFGFASKMSAVRYFFELWSRRFLDTNVLAKECAAA